jgi:hypothetical protein
MVIPSPFVAYSAKFRRAGVLCRGWKNLARFFFKCPFFFKFNQFINSFGLVWGRWVRVVIQVATKNDNFHKFSFLAVLLTSTRRERREMTRFVKWLARRNPATGDFGSNPDLYLIFYRHYFASPLQPVLFIFCSLLCTTLFPLPLFDSMVITCLLSNCRINYQFSLYLFNSP